MENWLTKKLNLKNLESFNALTEKLQKILVGEPAATLDAKRPSYENLRITIVRGLGFVYAVAFSIVYFQGLALWGKDGLLPIDRFIQPILNRSHVSGAFWRLPSLFYFITPDVALRPLALLGITLAVVMMLGYANFWILLVPWAIQLSLVNSGQLFYGYGWETQILEFTFLSFFLVPLMDPRLRHRPTPAPRVVIWAMRWMLFRLMLGAGLIKIRGDQCWRDLTCLIPFYETQPNPHPLSYFFFQLPSAILKLGVVANHFVELIVPFGFFGPAWLRRICGIIAIFFQFNLILSGNLSWLNWLSIVMCFACFDDQFLAGVRPLFRRPPQPVIPTENCWAQRYILAGFAVLIIGLSWSPTINLLSPRQAMNTSYNYWHLLNSYGAFGSVGKERLQVIISATTDSILWPETTWEEYQFKCAPGDVTRRPCLVTPYHYHLDWQMWFSAMYPELREEWLYRLAVRLLEKDSGVEELFASVPFSEKPTFIKMDLYRYRFAKWSDWPRVWWERERVGEYLPPTELKDTLTEGYRKSSKSF